MVVYGWRWTIMIRITCYGIIWHKSKNFIQAYNKIKKWIRKQLKKGDMYTESGSYIKGDFSEDILKLVMEKGI